MRHAHAQEEHKDRVLWAFDSVTLMIIGAARVIMTSHGFVSRACLLVHHGSIQIFDIRASVYPRSLCYCSDFLFFTVSTSLSLNMSNPGVYIDDFPNGSNGIIAATIAW